MIKISRIEICVGGAESGGRGGTVVKSNYTNGYSGLGWSTANTAQQSLMKNGLFHLSPLSSLGGRVLCWCHSHCHDAYDQCERDLYF